MQNVWFQTMLPTVSVTQDLFPTQIQLKDVPDALKILIVILVKNAMKTFVLLHAPKIPIVLTMKPVIQILVCVRKSFVRTQWTGLQSSSVEPMQFVQ